MIDLQLTRMISKNSQVNLDNLSQVSPSKKNSFPSPFEFEENKVSAFEMKPIQLDDLALKDKKISIKDKKVDSDSNDDDDDEFYDCRNDHEEIKS
jgi:hypothetical protein